MLQILLGFAVSFLRNKSLARMYPVLFPEITFAFLWIPDRILLARINANGRMVSPSEASTSCSNRQKQISTLPGGSIVSELRAGELGRELAEFAKTRRPGKAVEFIRCPYRCQGLSWCNYGWSGSKGWRFTSRTELASCGAVANVNAEKAARLPRRLLRLSLRPVTRGSKYKLLYLQKSFAIFGSASRANSDNRTIDSAIENISLFKFIAMPCRTTI